MKQILNDVETWELRGLGSLSQKPNQETLGLFKC